MSRNLDPAVATIIEGFKLDPKLALWNCHGTWCMYHRTVEKIAAELKIRFDPPTVIEANGAEKSVAICVTGRYADREEWSIGEASPATCKNAYPYAMAEKRAKDRVILKLIGLHGLIYSDAEIGTNGDSNEEPPTPTQPPVKSSGDFLRECKARITEFTTAAAVLDWLRTPELAKSVADYELTGTEREQIKGWARERREELAAQADQSGIPTYLDRRQQRNGNGKDAR